MKNTKFSFGKTGCLLLMLLWCFGMTAFAAPSVEGDTQLKAKKDSMVSAQYTITADDTIDSVKLVLSYDKDVLTYMSGSGGDNFSGNGGNGTVELSSKPGSDSASFEVKFKGNDDADTTVTISSCVIESNGEQIDALTGENVSSEQTATDSEEEDEEDDGNRASFVIDNRTFYVHTPHAIDGFSGTKIDINGISSKALKSDTLDLYVIRLNSDNGTFRDDFVYNPDTGNIVPFIQMQSGNDTVIFIEPETDGYVPTRYTYVDLGWGQKYTIPAYKHYTVDGVDHIQDDSNRYLVYGINQDGEKNWYNFDYDKNSLQLFDDVAYQGEQDYITELETKENGLRDDLEWQAERYNRDMGRRLVVILVMTLLVIVLANVAAFQYFHMKKMVKPEEDENDDYEPAVMKKKSSSLVVGNLEENETDFEEPEDEADEDDEDGDDELEIIDLDDDDK